MRGDRTCLICGAAYNYCPSCGNGDPNETWRYTYDSQNCRSIFDVASRYRNGRLTAEEASKRFKDLDLSRRLTFSDEIKGILEEVSSTDKKKKNVIVNEDSEQ